MDTEQPVKLWFASTTKHQEHRTRMTTALDESWYYHLMSPLTFYLVTPQALARHQPYLQPVKHSTPTPPASPIKSWLAWESGDLNSPTLPSTLESSASKLS
jgi:hypothetical protein